jgi:hypothetical protein
MCCAKNTEPGTPLPKGSMSFSREKRDHNTNSCSKGVRDEDSLRPVKYTRTHYHETTPLSDHDGPTKSKGVSRKYNTNLSILICLFRFSGSYGSPDRCVSVWMCVYFHACTHRQTYTYIYALHYATPGATSRNNDDSIISSLPLGNRICIELCFHTPFVLWMCVDSHPA